MENYFGKNMDMATTNREKSSPTRIRLKTTDNSITRSGIIEIVFATVEVPFIRIFGERPNFTALCKERDANKMLKTETREKLRRKGIEVQVPMELKSKKTVFLRRLDKYVGQHTKEKLRMRS